jgi:hypothetical protein
MEYNDILIVIVASIAFTIVEILSYRRGYKEGYKIGCIETNIKNQKAGQPVAIIN